MDRLGRFALAASMVALSACTSTQAVNEKRSAEIAAFVADMRTDALPANVHVVSNFDAMRTALPGFDIERGKYDAAGTAQVSVIRDISFPRDSATLPDSEVKRLSPLQVYLEKNPGVVVLIEGYGDGGAAGPRDTELSRMRAQTVARTLSASMSVDNEIISVAGPYSKGPKRGVEIKLSDPPRSR